jgi:hypothetical protein
VEELESGQESKRPLNQEDNQAPQPTNHDTSGLCVYVCVISAYIFFNEFYDEHVRMVKKIILRTKDKLMKSIEQC